MKTERPYPALPVLMVDDEEPIVRSYEMSLARAGITNTIPCSDSTKAMALLNAHGADLVLLDLRMPHVPGQALLEEITLSHPDVPVVIITGNEDIESAVGCMKQGAYDYLVKPISRERLVATVRHALAMRALERENTALREKMLSQEIAVPEAFKQISTTSPVMHSIFTYIEAVARTPHPVLMTGETGVGKELMARAIHRLSERKGELVSVNVAGLDDNVFADTLFGHVKGAFTGADTSRPGMIEAAAGGTLFLDEIGDLSPASQVKLLRLLQEGEYTPLGQDRPRRSDARVVVATNVETSALRDAARFRPDLYFRLSTHHVHLPPLRERIGDLPLLVDDLLSETARSLGKKKPTPPKELIPLLSLYRFPGNIRELEAMITDAVSTHKSGVLSLNSFKEHIAANSRHVSNPNPGATPHTPASPTGNDLTFGPTLPPLKDAKTLLIEEAMRRADGNITRAAELLGATRQALSWHLRKK